MPLDIIDYGKSKDKHGLPLTTVRLSVYDMNNKCIIRLLSLGRERIVPSNFNDALYHFVNRSRQINVANWHLSRILSCHIGIRIIFIGIAHL